MPARRRLRGPGPLRPGRDPRARGASRSSVGVGGGARRPHRARPDGRAGRGGRSGDGARARRRRPRRELPRRAASASGRATRGAGLARPLGGAARAAGASRARDRRPGIGTLGRPFPDLLPRAREHDARAAGAPAGAGASPRSSGADPLPPRRATLVHGGPRARRTAALSPGIAGVADPLADGRPNGHPDGTGVLRGHESLARHRRPGRPSRGVRRRARHGREGRRVAVRRPGEGRGLLGSAARPAWPRDPRTGPRGMGAPARAARARRWRRAPVGAGAREPAAGARAGAPPAGAARGQHQLLGVAATGPARRRCCSTSPAAPCNPPGARVPSARHERRRGRSGCTASPRPPRATSSGCGCWRSSASRRSPRCAMRA